MLGLAYLSDGRTSEAVDAFETTLALSPDFSLAHHNLGIALMLDGRPDEAIAALQKEERENWRMTGMAMALFALENTGDETPGASSAADLALTELVAKHGESSAYKIAYVYAYRNDANSAFDWLSKAVETEDPGMGEVLSQPLLSNLHEDLRWIPFLSTLGKTREQLAGITIEVSLPQ